MDSQTIYRRRWMILSVLIVGLLAIVIDNTVLNVALKTIAEPRGGLGASQSQLEWAINSYTLVFAGLLFTFGVIGDQIGRKRMLMIGLALFGVASLLSAYSRSPEQLIFARAAMGLGGAAVMPQTLSIISNVFEPAERPRAIGLWATAVGLGVATGPVLGGLLLDHFWWGSVFLINVPVTVVGVIAAAILVPESRNREAGGIDYVGVLLSIAGLVLLVYGIVQGGDIGSWITGRARPDRGRPGRPGRVRLVRDPDRAPVAGRPAVPDRRLSASVGAIGLTFFGMGGVFFFTSFYLQNVRGYTPLAAGLLTVPFAAGQLLLSPRSAPMVQRYGAKASPRPACSSWPRPSPGTPPSGPLADLAARRCCSASRARRWAWSCRPPPRRSWTCCPASGPGRPALTNTARQVAVALSVAVLGSILAEFYRNSLSPTLAALPAGVREAASSSISATQAVAQQLGPSGRLTAGPANEAFVHSMRYHHAGRGGAGAGRRVRGAALDAGQARAAWRPASRRPGSPRWLANPSGRRRSQRHEAELAIMEADMLDSSDREG